MENYSTSATMKFIIAAVALLLVVNNVRSDSSEEVLETVKSKHLKKYLSEHKDHLDEGLEKLEAQCPGVSTKLKSAIAAFGECDDKTDDSLTICEAIQRYTLNCTTPLLKVIDDCLPQRAKGLPVLGVKSLLSAADHLCKQSGETIFELGNPCIWEDLEQETDELKQCEEKVKEFAGKYNDPNTLPTKTDICSSLTSFRSCVVSQTNAACKNPKTKTSVLGLYDALIAPCSHINEA